jgi:hypothetical protein
MTIASGSVFDKFGNRERCDYCHTYFKCQRIYKIGEIETRDYCGDFYCDHCNPQSQPTVCLTHMTETILFCNNTCYQRFMIACSQRPLVYLTGFWASNSNICETSSYWLSHLNVSHDTPNWVKVAPTYI